jgi:ribosomal protein S18 acetylase RimI-like enzyme
MGQPPSDLRRTLGAAARLWAGSGRHEVDEDGWLALSGERNVNYNLACCLSASTDVLADRYLQPLLELGKPGIIMLGGPGLATAQKLVDAGWVSVGALPLMILEATDGASPAEVGPRPLSLAELPLARQLLADTYGLDDSTAVAAVPDRAAEDGDLSAWGLFEGDHLVTAVTVAVEDGLAVVWSMATRPECQGRGYGRRLLEPVLRHHFDRGATGSLLHSSVAGERLYRSLGYAVVDYLQLWSRPRWVLGFA